MINWKQSYYIWMWGILDKWIKKNQQQIKEYKKLQKKLQNKILKVS